MARQEFTAKTKGLAFQRAGGCCEQCGIKLQAGRIEYDHRIPCALGGDNSLDNCVVLCYACHRSKTSCDDIPRIAKANRQHRAHFIGKTAKTKPMPFGRKSGLKRKMDGTIVRREHD